MCIRDSFRIVAYNRSNNNQLANVEILKEDLSQEQEVELRSKGLISTLKELACQYIDLIVSKAEIAEMKKDTIKGDQNIVCLLYTSPSPRDRQKSRMPSSA
eukprot:TRINITY_DN1836_c0_g1_i1.p2 TRINITY_DN1836_c0_g1~~TRINITY_DN1836_c0_g1_i1.p2  ORF type:complete len:101 (+),score=38.36 TRINITY_DN1836_c0_g1_i1:64-366(+)